MLTIIVKLSDSNIGNFAQTFNFKHIWNEWRAVKKTDPAFYAGRYFYYPKIWCTGLGMNLTKRLAEVLGIKMKVKSLPNERTCFEFTIPLIYQSK